MKKKYNKPTVDIMEIEGNDVICGTCSDKGYLTAIDQQSLQFFFEYDGKKGISDAEKYDTFAKTEDCNLKVNFGKYCKFASVDNKKQGIAWS